jgi:ribosomal protein L29
MSYAEKSTAELKELRAELASRHPAGHLKARRIKERIAAIDAVIAEREQEPLGVRMNRHELETAMRAGYGRRAVEAGISHRRDDDRQNAAVTIANVLQWLDQSGIDAEAVHDAALHRFLIERADAAGWERVRAETIEEGETIARDVNNRPEGEGRRVVDAPGIGAETIDVSFSEGAGETFEMDELIWRKVEAD